MDIIITDVALDWFKREMEIDSGDAIRFYVRYGGTSPFYEGFSLGMNREKPHQIGIKTERDNVTFYIEKDDLWFFNDHHLLVSVDPDVDELIYDYKLS